MPESSPLALATLQVIRKQFNKLNMKEMLFIDYLLRDYHESTAIALKMAIPLVLEYCYCIEPLPSDLNPFHLTHGLIVCVNNDSMALAEKFMVALYKHKPGVKDFSAKSVVSLVTGLLTMFLHWKRTPGHLTQELLHEVDLEVTPEEDGGEVQAAQEMKLIREVLLKEALQYITKNITKLANFEVKKVLSDLSYSYSRKDFCAYNQPLLCAYTKRAIDQDWPLSSLATGVIRMLKMNEVDELLVQALLKKLSSAPASELATTELHTTQLVHALVASNNLSSYNEEEQHALLAKLMQHPSAPLYRKDHTKIPIGRLGFDLACLGYFEPAVHQNIMNSLTSKITTLESGDLSLLFKPDLLTLWQAQQLLNTKHERVQVDNSLVAAAKKFVISQFNREPMMADRTMVRKVLLQALSSYSPNSVVTGVQTHHGVCVDHVIVVRGKNEVVPQPDNVEEMVCLDDLCVPDDARILGVLQTGSHLLLNKYTMLKPLVRLNIQLLAAEGVTAVPLIMPQFLLNYKTDEKIRFLTAALGQHHLYL